MSESFPRQHARTRRFSLGVPRNLGIVDGGRQVLFLRSQGGADPVTCLWSLDTASGATTLLVDPANLGVDEADLPAAEKARRERAREQAGGIVGYTTGGDRGSVVVFTLGGVLHRFDLASGDVEALDTPAGAFDPRLSPSGDAIAYVVGDELRLIDGAGDRTLAAADPDDPSSATVSWGSAEFIAGEEMRRTRGHWWAPDGAALAVARVDVAGVDVWQLADPTHPERPVQPMRYPAAGTPNAEVSLWIVGRDGAQVEVDIDWAEWEYLADVAWDANGLRAVLQTRDQRRMAILDVDPATGSTSVRREITDDIWVEIVPGVPSFHDGRLITVEERDGTRQMCLDGEPVSGTSWWVRGVAGSLLGGVVFTASPDPSEVHVMRWTPAGVEQLTSEPGVHGAVVGDEVLVVTTSTLESAERRVEVRAGAAVHSIDDLSEEPVIEPRVTLHRVGARDIPVAVLFPNTDAEVPEGPLPVLLDPYGGPHAQRVLRNAHAFTTSQWFADQGFVVVVADGRGTPAVPGEWERSVYGDLAAPVLDDQLDALHAVAELYPGRLDLDRVGIRGWSFGGYLAALAVLRRPDAVHVGIAGAPVTDWRLYDTHYTERYLGQPDLEPENYERTSLLNDAPQLDRPLMLIHGLADDNVVAAHTLQLSRALLEAGRPHTVLPLSGVSHMTPQEVVAENLLRLQVDFLRTHLG